jgi:hypothetical protein
MLRAIAAAATGFVQLSDMHCTLSSVNFIVNRFCAMSRFRR